MNPDGAKYWRMSYRFLGKEKLLAFGKYPEVTLAEARQRRLEAKWLISTDIDPSAEKKERRRAAEERAANTLEKIARECHTNRLPTWRESTDRDTIALSTFSGRLPLSW
jgi:hypothetical protein